MLVYKITKWWCCKNELSLFRPRWQLHVAGKARGGQTSGLHTGPQAKTTFESILTLRQNVKIHIVQPKKEGGHEEY